MHNSSELTISRGGEETTVPLVRQFLLGARLDADVILADTGASPTHFVINPSSNGALLVVLDQAGHLPVEVDGEQVTEARRLRHGQVVQVGSVRLIYRNGGAKGGSQRFQSAPSESTSSPLESQRWTWLASERPSPDERAVRMLYRLANLVATASGEATLLREALELALAGVAADQGVVAARGEEGSIVPIEAAGIAVGDAAGDERPSASLPFDRRCLERALDESLTSTVEVDGSTLYVPIGVSGVPPVGALGLRRSSGPTFTGAELELTASVGRLLAVALERVRLLKQLQAGSLALGAQQRRFEATLAAIVEGLVLRYSDGTLEPLNGEGRRLLGQLLGQPFEAGLELPQGSEVAALVEQAHHSQGQVREALLVGGRWHEISVSPVTGLDAVVIVLRDVTTQRKTELDLREEVLTVSGREQRWIGQTLHDGLCQQLVGISLLTQGIAARTQGTPQGVIATEVVNLLTKAAEDTRRLAKGLCPVALETSGLGSALEELGESFGKMYPHVSCVVRREGEVFGPRDPIATQLYHLAQEAINNAIKHGQAARVEVRLEENEAGVTLWVENDGALFVEPSETKGMGLRTMRYRAQMLGADLTIRAGVSGGTVVACRLRREGDL